MRQAASESHPQWKLLPVAAPAVLTGPPSAALDPRGDWDPSLITHIGAGRFTSVTAIVPQVQVRAGRQRPGQGLLADPRPERRDHARLVAGERHVDVRGDRQVAVLAQPLDAP